MKHNTTTTCQLERDGRRVIVTDVPALEHDGEIRLSARSMRYTQRLMKAELSKLEAGKTKTVRYEERA